MPMPEREYDEMGYDVLEIWLSWGQVMRTYNMDQAGARAFLAFHYDGAALP